MFEDYKDWFTVFRWKFVVCTINILLDFDRTRFHKSFQKRKTLQIILLSKLSLETFHINFAKYSKNFNWNVNLFHFLWRHKSFKVNNKKVLQLFFGKFIPRTSNDIDFCRVLNLIQISIYILIKSSFAFMATSENKITFFFFFITRKEMENSRFLLWFQSWNVAKKIFESLFTIFSQLDSWSFPKLSSFSYSHLVLELINIFRSMKKLLNVRIRMWIEFKKFQCFFNSVGSLNNWKAIRSFQNLLILHLNFNALFITGISSRILGLIFLMVFLTCKNIFWNYPS